MEDYMWCIVVAALIVGTVAIISYIIYKANASSKEKCEQLKRDNPSLVRFEKDLDSNKLKRHQVCDGYLMTLLTFRTALKEFMESKALFKSSVFSTTMLNSMVSAVSSLLNKVTTYLDADLKEFVEVTQLENGMKLNMAFKHSISDIGRKMFDYPEICLRKYSCYFVDLLKMCEMINEGVKRKFAENQEVKDIAKEIDALLAEYKPISKLFDQIRTNKKEIFQKLNLRYRDKIERVEHLSEIFDNTYFLIFDDIIVFTGKFYKHMDDIKEITDKDVKKIE